MAATGATAAELDLSPEQLTRARAETPSVQRALHFNHAGASPPPEPVLERVVAHLRREAEVGGYQAADEVADELAGVYDAIAALLGAARDEVALVEHATLAWTKAISSVPLGAGDVVLIAGRAEYAANMVEILRLCKEKGCSVKVAPSDSTGQVPRHGAVGPPGAPGRAHARAHERRPGEPRGARGRRVPRARRALPAGRVPIGGPARARRRQAGLRLPRRHRQEVLARAPWHGLPVRQAFQPGALGEPALLDHWAAPLAEDGRSYQLSGTARRFEFWEGAVASRLGLGVAVRYFLSLGPAAVEARVVRLAAQLRAGLWAAQVPGLEVVDLGARRCGIVTFHLGAQGPPAAELKRALIERGAFVSTSPPASTALDAQARGLPELLRASVHYVNTEEDRGGPPRRVGVRVRAPLARLALVTRARAGRAPPTARGKSRGRPRAPKLLPRGSKRVHD
ncbi:unnamed protein product [Prorocentrum cordatum]|uniref:Aminotransferase class V domain-containing protein n=1 Tax=Prorocentrum cordatum TaxID=2364126 RepID=A0ABN9W9I5_9DINO|nr:unnamed protein product [Polarella glacialis]